MPDPKLKIEGVDIVCLGSFNPQVLHPYWLAAQELIRKEEAETAQVEVVHPELAAVTVGSVKVQVTHNRFSTSTEDPSSYEVARDLAMGYLKILHHSPVKVMGINRNVHYLMPSEDAWHQIGHRVAPKDVWSDILIKPGLRSLTMEGKRPDNFKGFIRVRVEPSTRIKPGVYITMNDHYEAATEEPGRGSEEFIEMLRANWKQFLGLSRKVIHSVLEIQDESAAG